MGITAIKSIIYLSLGSNLNEPKQNILNAYQLIQEEIGSIVSQSSFLENEAQGFYSESTFINTAIEVHTHLSPRELLFKTQKIEKRLGRKTKTTTQYESRIIDIDVLLYNDEIIQSDELQIPHPLLQERDFVLIPLLEIAPHLIIPGTNKTVKELHAKLEK
jgi:2-amino-4-hydroxy-6-hydroxymethyldihydropteridine diphosphokinase